MKNRILSYRIKELCKEKKITVKSLLESCQMNRNTIYDLEKKSVFPSGDKLARIADRLNVSVDYLLGRTDDPDIRINDEDSTEKVRLMSNFDTMNKDSRTSLLSYSDFLKYRDGTDEKK